jgi:DNA-binding transcriptional LysR family regulator
MDFRELSYVLAIAKYQNITKAAESLYVGQPTLSKFLIALENELGLKLFRKMGHRYILTYAGERYVDKAIQILRLKNELTIELDDIIKRDVGVLNVAFANMRCTYMLPCTLPAFQDLHPNVKVNVFEGTSDENDRRLLDGQVDVAFYSQPSILNPLIEYQTLGEEELLVCTCKNHPIGLSAQPEPSSSHPKVDISLLKNEKILMMQPEQRTRQIVDNYIHEHGIKFENTLCTSNLSAIMELVSIGYGVSFIFEPHLRHRVASLPIECYSFGTPNMVSNFVAAYRKGSYLPRYVQEFIEIVHHLYPQT